MPIVYEFHALGPRRADMALLDGILLQWAYMYAKELDVDAQLRFSVQLFFQGLVKHS